VTFRSFQFLARQLLLVIALAFACVPAQAADVEITRAAIDKTDEGYRLDAHYAFELNPAMKDAIEHGIPLYFTTEIQVVRPRWYWRDEVAIRARQTARISYDVLIRQYHVSYIGSVRQTFSTLEDAMFYIRRPGRWLIGPKSALKSGETYTVTLRMGMDREYLSKPIQVNAFNDSDWRLNSNTKRFNYRAE
jgi:hypothetical protein